MMSSPIEEKKLKVLWKAELAVDFNKKKKSFGIQRLFAFFPPFKKAGRIKIDIPHHEKLSVTYRSPVAVTEIHEKVALGIMKVITDAPSYDEKEVIKKTSSKFQLSDSLDYAKYSFSLKKITKRIMGRVSPENKKRFETKLGDLASITAIYDVGQIGSSDFRSEPHQWFFLPKIEGDTVEIYISAVFIRFLFNNPLQVHFDWLMSLNKKAFRAGMMIEESRYRKKNWADWIPHSEALMLDPEETQGVKVAIDMMSNAFFEANQAGYPLYVPGMTEGGELTWCRVGSSKTQEAIRQYSKLKNNDRTIQFLRHKMFANSRPLQVTKDEENIPAKNVSRLDKM